MNVTAVLVLAVIFISTFIRSAFGFGDALVAMPLLAVLLGMKTATPLVALVATSIAFTILLRNWRDVRLESAWRLICFTVLGIPIGLIFLKGAHENLMKAILAGIITAFALFNLLRPTFLYLKNDRWAPLFGFIGGILGGAYNTNGPPVVIFGSLRKWPPASFRATMQGYLFPTGFFILVGHGLSGLWTHTVFMHYAAAIPVLLFGVWIGGKVHRSIPRGKFDLCIHVLLICIGLFLFGQTFTSVFTKG